jgi:hypothetical protein
MRVENIVEVFPVSSVPRLIDRRLATSSLQGKHWPQLIKLALRQRLRREIRNFW